MDWPQYPNISEAVWDCRDREQKAEKSKEKENYFTILRKLV